MLNFQIAEFIPQPHMQRTPYISERCFTPATAGNTGNEHRASRDRPSRALYNICYNLYTCTSC